VKTEELVSLLATGAEAVEVRMQRRRFVLALLAGTAAALGLTASWLGFRSNLPADFPQPLFWYKEVFCVGLSAAGAVAAFRLGRPGSRPGRSGIVVAALVCAMALLAALTLVTADADRRAVLLFGQTSKVCSIRIALVSTPVLVGLFAAMKALAPTRLRWAGAASGFAAGSIGALAYSLHCPELAAPFVVLWYGLGISIPTLLGVWMGPMLLRW